MAGQQTRDRGATFTGFPEDGLTFYEQLGADNTKVFWQANKDRFTANVREPMVALAEALDAYGPFHLFRPHNDLRFSKNKPPYKTHQGAYGESEAGAGYYVQFSAEGLMAGTGYYAMAKDQLKRFRDAVVAEHTGREIEAILTELGRQKYSIGAIDELKTAPRGYDKEHPRIAIIRRKGLLASKSFGAPKWIHTKQVTRRVKACWDGASEMNAWLDAHVGPSTEPPGDRPF